MTDMFGEPLLYLNVKVDVLSYYGSNDVTEYNGLRNVACAKRDQITLELGNDALSSLLGGGDGDTGWSKSEGDPSAGDKANDTLTSVTSTNSEEIVTRVGLSLSLLALLVTIILQIVNENLSSTPGKVIVSLTLSLFVAQLLFLFKDFPNMNAIVCKIVAILSHLSWLLSFSWSNTMVMDLVRVISNQTATRQRGCSNSYPFYLFLASLFPVLIVTPCVILDFTTSFVEYGIPGDCWIQYQQAQIYLFATPIGVSIVINILLLIFVFAFIYKTRQITNFLGENAVLSHRRSAIICLKLASVMGLTWIFGFVGAILGNRVLLYMFTATNSFQGVFIFFGLSYNHTAVKRWLGRRLRRSGARKDGVTSDVCKSGMSNEITKATENTTVVDTRKAPDISKVD